MTLFFLGLVLSIPLSIFSNAYTPKVLNWFARKNASRAATRLEVLEAEYEQVRALNEDRSLLREFLLVTVLRTTFVASVAGILAGFFYVLLNVLNAAQSILIGPYLGRLFSGALGSAGQLIGVVGGLLVVSYCSGALRTYARVRDFASYEQAVQKQFALLGRADTVEGAE